MLAVGRLSTVAIFRALGSQGMDARSQGGVCQAQGSRGPDASNKVKVSYELTLKVHTYDFSNILLTKLVTQDSPDLKGGKLYYLWSSDIVSKAFSKDFFFFLKMILLSVFLSLFSLSSLERDTPAKGLLGHSLSQSL